MATSAHLTKDRSYNLDDIKTQVEYYLSDKNLRQDAFFHDMISKDPNHSITIEAIMKCNKIKKMNIDSGIIVEAIAKSSEVEVNADKTAIKRKNNPAIPDLDPQPEKKIISEKNGSKNGHNVNRKPEEHKHEEEKEKAVIKDPLVFVLKTEQPYLAGRKSLQEKIEAVIGMPVPYCRMAKVEGNFVVDKTSLPEEIKNKVATEGFTYENLKFDVKVAEGGSLKTFWDKHGLHYNTCIGGKERTQKDKDKDRKNKKFASKEITFGNEKYADITRLKNIFKNILQQVSDEEIVKEPHHTMLLELLKFHDHHEQKLKDLQHFTVGPHPEHKDSRCFFVVRKDGHKEDFSAKKCLENLEAKLG
jgi:hypothetical protein